MRSDNLRDDIKREHVIFTQACLRSRQRRANYVYVSASAGQIWNWSGEGRFEKNVRTSGKILATSLISPSAFAICVSAVNICIWSFLAWVSMMWIIYKHDDLGYSQELNLPFSSQVHLTMLISILWQPKISSGWQVEVLEQQSSSTHLLPAPFPP